MGFRLEMEGEDRSVREDDGMHGRTLDDLAEDAAAGASVRVLEGGIEAYFAREDIVGC